MARLVKGQEFRLRSLFGLRQLVTAIGSTMGVNGGNVMWKYTEQHFGLTKDGVTVATNFFITRDSVAHAISSYVKQVSQRTNKLVGDGTSTSNVLATELYERGLMFTGQYPKTTFLREMLPKSMTLSDASRLPAIDYEAYDYFSLKENTYSPTTYLTPRKFRDVLDDYTDSAVKYLYHLREKMNLTPEEIVRHVAHTSSNGDALITDLFVEAFKSVNMDGVVIAEADLVGSNTVGQIDGFSFEGHAINPVLLNPNTMSQEYENPLVLVTDKYLDSDADVAQAIKLSRDYQRPFVLVCSDISDQLLSAMVRAMISEGVKGIPVKAPYYGTERVDFLHDLCVATGATFIDTEGNALRNYERRHCGTVPRVIVNSTGTKLIGHLDNPKIAEKVEERVQAIRTTLEDVKSEREREILEKRINNLKGKVATISVKVETEAEREEVAYRLEDALNAIQGALEKGVLPGGGTSLILCARHMQKEFYNKDFANMMFDVLVEPFNVLIKNSGGDPAEYIKKLDALSEDNPIGIELRSMEVANMISQGVLDPLKVTESVLKTACSISKTLLQTQIMLSND